MADVLLTQLYDKEGNPLYPRINLKTVNGVPLYATGDPNDEDYNQEDNNIVISSQAKVKIVYIYKANDTQPNIPNGGFISDAGVLTYPDGWSDEAQARREIEDDNTKKLWRSYATLTYGANIDESEWSVPSLINELNAGTDGMDGSDIKIVYCLTEENNAPNKPKGNGDTFVGSNNKGEWSEEPIGIDDTYKYEWVSMSIKEGGYNKSFSDFTAPTLWAKWGEDGTDGAGVEYVYLLTNSNENPSINYDMNEESYQKPEYYPTTDEGVEWSDNYTAPTYNQRYSWVAIRHYKDGKWEKFSEPKLWNIYKVAGKAYADLYRRSKKELSSEDLPNYEGSVYYLFENDKYYSSADKENEILQVGEWFGDVPTEGGRYLYKTQAYIDIVDIDRVVEITKDKWSGPYFISLDGKDGENAIAESAYISMNNDSFSLPITDLHKTFMGIEYKDSLDVKLMYGDDELVIKAHNIDYNNKIFDNVDVSLSSDNKILTIEFKIKNDVEIVNVEDILITLTGDYNNKEFTAKKSFRIIPYVSTIGEFFKIRINDDTIYVDQNGCVEENGDIWKHTITVDLVDSKGNYIDVSNIGCKFVYENKIGGNADITDGKIYIKNCLNTTVEGYIDVINLPNPLIIKLVDNETNIVREVEYIDFINKPQDGNNGEPGVSNRMVFAYRSTEDYNAPETPTGGDVNFDTNEVSYPENWGPSQDLGGVVWLSTREFFSDGPRDLSWSKPMRITGEQGLAGEDGTKIEFAYHLCESENVFSELESPSGDIIYFPVNGKDATQWTDNPQGIDATYIIETCSQRTCDEKGDWTEWSKPFIWSKWGEDGTDGDGVEYIFKILSEKQEEFYPLSDDVYESDNQYVKNILQENDFVPNAEYVNRYVDANDIDDDNALILHNLFDKNWTDEPRDVGVNEPYEYVSIRRKKNGVWGSFSKATLWNEWHRDGYNTYTEFAFTAIPSNDTLVGYDVSGGTYDNPLEDLRTYNILDQTKTKDVKWSDTLPDYDENKSIWMISAFFSEDKNYDNNGWTSPKKMTDSQTLQVEYCDSSINPADGITEMSDLVTTYPELTLEELENEFRKLEKSRGFTWGDEKIVNPNWMATSRRVNGNWSNWVVTKIKGEKGDPGAKGDPGTSVQFKGSFNTVEELQRAYAFYRTKEGNLPNPYFTDDNLSAGDGYIINGELWVYDGSLEVFSSAWINVGQIKGDKGDSVYLYIAYSNDEISFTPPLTKDDALGTTPGKYIGICIKNIKVQNFPNDNNQFNEFTWSKWQGDDGFGVEQIFILHDSSIKELPTPNGVRKEVWNAQDYKPTNWSDTPLTPTILEPYCLMAVRNYPPKIDELDKNGYNLFKGDDSNNAIIFSYLAKDGSNGSDGSNGIDGTSPFHIELSNSYDQVYVVDNVVETTQEVSTNIKVFKGSEDITNKVNISVNNNDASYIDGVVKKVFSVGDKIDASTKELIYTITVDKDPSIGLDYPLQSVFKIVKLNGNIDYDLEVYPPYITVATNDNNKYSNDTINIKVTKSNISTTERNTTYVNELPGYFIRYNIDGDNIHDVTYNSSEGITLDSSIVKSIKNYIKIELKDGSTTLDNYSVEILRDGKNGVDGIDGNSPYHIELSNDFDLIYTVDGLVNGEQTFETDLQLILGNLPVAFINVSINNIDSSIKPSITPSDDNKSAKITLTIPDKFNLPSNINGSIKVTYNSEYDSTDKVYEIYAYFTLKPINDESLYQIQATPSFITRTQDTSVFVKLYRKGNSGLELMSEIPTDVNFKYSLNNSSTLNDIKNVVMGINKQIKVYDWVSTTDTTIKEIDIRLYKGNNLHDNVNIEVKEDIKPSAVFDITPNKYVVYLDSQNKAIQSTETMTISFIYEGRTINVTDASIKCDGYDSGSSINTNIKHEVSLTKKYNNKFDINPGTSAVNNEGTYVYTVSVDYGGNKYYKNIYITYVKSSLTVTSLFDTLQISSYKKKYIQNGGYESASDMFEFDVYFNDKNVTSDCEISLVETKDTSMNNYIKEGGIFFNYRGNSWYMNYILKDSSTYDITNFIKNKGEDAKILMKFTYDGISVVKEWYLTTTDINSNYLSIQCSPQRIMDSNENSPIEMYIEEGVVNYVTIEDLIDKYKMSLWYSIDNGEYIEINKDTTIAKSRGNYAFYPNGLIIYDAKGEEIRQEPILKEIKFRILDANNNLVDVQSVERIDILQDTYLAKIQPNSNGISLNDLFDGVNYTSDMDVIIL